jgi:cytochrome P450
MASGMTPRLAQTYGAVGGELNEEACKVASQPEPVKFPLPPSPVPYDTGPEVRALAARCPVNRVELPDGSLAWAVTGFSEVREVLIDQRYSRALACAPDRPKQGMEFLLAESLMGMDPPEHSRLRKLAASAFTEKRMQVLRPEVTRIVDSLLDEMIAGPRPADLVRSFSLPLPSRVICSLLGVPPDHLDTFHGWSNTLFADWSRTKEEMDEAYSAINGYMAGLIAVKRKKPADDLISALIDARDSGDRLSEDELVRFCFGLLMAGHETTANQLNMSFVALCHHPAELARLRADPGLIPAAVEELLRFVQITGKAGIPPARITREEVSLGGVTIPAGEAVLPMMNVANRDPVAFPDPNQLDLLREPKTNIAFGAGAHHCLGAQLARMELQEGLRGLLTRLPGLRMAVPLSEVDFREGHLLASMRELPVTWDDS